MLTVTVGNFIVSIIAAVMATVGTIYLIFSACRKKYLYKNPFSKITYRIQGKVTYASEDLTINLDRKMPIKLQAGRSEICVELIPRVKYTVSEVNLRFLLNTQNTTNAEVMSLKDLKLESEYDFTSREDRVGGYFGSYNLHRVVSKGDTVAYKAELDLKSSWEGNLQLSLRITAEEFGRHAIRFQCNYRERHKHVTK